MPDRIIRRTLDAARPTAEGPTLAGPATGAGRSSGHSILRSHRPSRRARPVGPPASDDVGATAMPVPCGPPPRPTSADMLVDVRRAALLAETRGYAAGLERAGAELAAAIQTAAAIAVELEALAPQETVRVAHSIAELALALARRVVDRELTVDPAVLVGAIEQAISTINGTPEARVFVHSDVVDVVAGAWADLHGTAFLGKRWRFEGDSSLPSGGCTVRFEHGFVDAGLESQLEELGLALNAAIPALRAPESVAR